MPNREFNSRRFGPELTRQLVTGAIIIILLIGVTFVAFRMGEGATFFAIGTFGVIGIIIGFVWLALKLIELISRVGDE